MFGFLKRKKWWSEILSTEQYATFETLVTEALYQHGVFFEIQSDGRIIINPNEDEPIKLNLESLAVKCRGTSQAEWPSTIADFFSRITKAMNEQEVIMAELADPEKTLPRLRTMIVNEDYLKHVEHDPNGDVCIHREAPLPGLHQVLVADFDGFNVVAPAPAARQWGYSDEDLLKLGCENAKANDAPDIESFDELPEDIFLLIHEEKPYVATHLLWIEEFPQLLGEHGALVGVPAQDTVSVHPITTAAALQEGMFYVLNYAMDKFHRSPNGITRDLFWFDGNTWLRIPAQAYLELARRAQASGGAGVELDPTDASHGDDAPEIALPKEFLELLGRLK